MSEFMTPVIVAGEISKNILTDRSIRISGTPIVGQRECFKKYAE
jgi:hypothetical protein